MARGTASLNREVYRHLHCSFLSAILWCHPGLHSARSLDPVSHCSFIPTAVAASATSADLRPAPMTYQSRGGGADQRSSRLRRGWIQCDLGASAVGAGGAMPMSGSAGVSLQTCLECIPLHLWAVAACRYGGPPRIPYFACILQCPCMYCGTSTWTSGRFAWRRFARNSEPTTDAAVEVECVSALPSALPQGSLTAHGSATAAGYGIAETCAAVTGFPTRRLRHGRELRQCLDACLDERSTSTRRARLVPNWLCRFTT